MKIANHSAVNVIVVITFDSNFKRIRKRERVQDVNPRQMARLTRCNFVRRWRWRWWSDNWNMITLNESFNEATNEDRTRVFFSLMAFVQHRRTKDDPNSVDVLSIRLNSWVLALVIKTMPFWKKLDYALLMLLLHPSTYFLHRLKLN